MKGRGELSAFMRYTSGSGEVEGKVLSVTRSTECRVIIGNHFVASGRTEESARCIFPTLHACPAYQEVTLHGDATAPPLSTLLHLPSLSFLFLLFPVVTTAMASAPRSVLIVDFFYSIEFGMLRAPSMPPPGSSLVSFCMPATAATTLPFA